MGEERQHDETPNQLWTSALAARVLELESLLREITVGAHSVLIRSKCLADAKPNWMQRAANAIAQNPPDLRRSIELSNPGDVIQIAPHVATWGGCFLIVSEVKAFGVQGYVLLPGRIGVPAAPAGPAFVRMAWSDLSVPYGPARWAMRDAVQGGSWVAQ